MRESLGVWLQAVRPFTLSAAVVPVLVGSMLAAQSGVFHAFLFVLVLVGSVLVQCGANLTDEYADHDADTARHKVQAPYKVIARGLLTPSAVLRGALTCFGLAALIGVYLVTQTGWPLAVVCLASVGVAYSYSAGPLPLGNVAMGEPLVFIFMGPIMVLGSYYVQTQTVTWTAVWLSIPVACLVTNILIANNLRDAEEDNLSGKTTIVHLWGRQDRCPALSLSAHGRFCRPGSAGWRRPRVLDMACSLPASTASHQGGPQRDAEHGTRRHASNPALHRSASSAFRPVALCRAGPESNPAWMIIQGSHGSNRATRVPGLWCLV